MFTVLCLTSNSEAKDETIVYSIVVEILGKHITHILDFCFIS